MSLRSQKNLKLVGAFGAVALAIGTVAAPALAVGGSRATVHYTCTTPITPATPSAVYRVKRAPAKMAVGQPLATTATFTLDAGTTGLAQGLGWSKFSGTIKTKPTASKAGLNLKFPKTTLGNGPGGTTNASATGGTLAGTKVGSFTFTLGGLGDVVLNGFDASGNPAGSVEFPTKGSFGKCTNDAGTTQLLSGTTPVTVKIVKDTTTTTETAKYSSKTHVAHGKAKVRSHYGTPATGTVKFILKKGTKILRTAKGTLNKKGVAKVSFKHVTAKGKYSITGKYTGSSTLKRSSGKATFTV